MPPLTLERLSALLGQYVQQSGKAVDPLLVGALALQGYRISDRATQDVEGEIRGELEPLVQFLGQHGIPADLGENMSGRSVVAMPPGCRERASVVHEEPGLRLRLLAPSDYVVAKPRRGTDLDLEDALLVARHFQIHPDSIRRAADSALAASPRDTALFFFKKTVEAFLKELSG